MLRKLKAKVHSEGNSNTSLTNESDGLGSSETDFFP